jgi:predicted GTPase
MYINSDYFLLYHGLNKSNTQTLPLQSKLSRSEFIELAALFLSAHRKNYNLFSSLEYFKELSQKLSPAPLTNIETLYDIQEQILTQLQTEITHEELLNINEAFDFLHTNEIISTHQYEQLNSLFDPELLAPKASSKTLHAPSSKNFLEQKEHFLQEIKKLLEEFSSTQAAAELREAKNYIQSQSFSIGITGVMNAGKSTMLNALMGQEILGSSVIPETANLTVVSYSSTPYAKVHYWDTKEWESLTQSAQNLEAMQKFVNETSQAFGNELSRYISSPEIELEIDINDLPLYTSAAKSDFKCNLVKYVELGVSLDFLSDGIEIVDTPGLDDPVIQREEITKEYMSHCDLMIHLMNVSQSATLKDVEFIIDALLYQNVSALLIVITRADSVSDKELDEVIEYTKQSIKKELLDLNQGSKIDFILNALTFIPISGYMALQHRTGKAHHALQAGFSLEQTGILDVEAYLNTTLFGAHSLKNSLIIQGIKSRIDKALTLEHQTLHYELTLLSQDTKQLEDTLKAFNEEKASNEATLQSMHRDIKLQKEQFTTYIHSLDGFIENGLIKLQGVIKNRLIADLKYTLEKDKKHPSHKQIKNILITALKDGIIDILRDYRYKSLQKMEQITQHVTQKYSNRKLAIDTPEGVDGSQLFKETFNSNFLASNHDQLLLEVYEPLRKAKLKTVDAVNQKIEAILQAYLSHLQTTIIDKAHALTTSLIETFFKNLEQPLDAFKNQLKEQEQMIHDYMSQAHQNETDKQNRALELHTKLKNIENLRKEYT